MTESSIVGVEERLGTIEGMLGRLQGAQESAERFHSSTMNDIRSEVASAKEAARLASQECANLDTMLRGVRGDNGLTSRVAAIEHRLDRSRWNRWTDGLLGALVLAIVLAALRYLGVL